MCRGDRFGAEFPDLVVGAAGRHAVKKIGHMRTPGVAFMLDHDDVLSHHSAFPTCLSRRQPSRSRVRMAGRLFTRRGHESDVTISSGGALMA